MCKDEAKESELAVVVFNRKKDPRTNCFLLMHKPVDNIDWVFCFVFLFHKKNYIIHVVINQYLQHGNTLLNWFFFLN